MEIGKERITNSWYYIYTHTHTLAYWPALCSRSIIKKNSNVKKNMKSIENILSVLDLAATQLYWILPTAGPSMF